MFQIIPDSICSESQKNFFISDENLLQQLLAESGQVKQNSEKNWCERRKEKRDKKGARGEGGDEGGCVAGGVQRARRLLQRRQHVQVHPSLQGLQQTGASTFLSKSEEILFLSNKNETRTFPNRTRLIKMQDNI